MKAYSLYTGVIVASIAVTLAFASGFLPNVLPSSCRELLTSMIVGSANIPLSIDGHSLKSTRLGWQVDTPTFHVRLVPAGLLDSIAQLPLFSLVILLITLLVWRHWNFGPVAGPVLTFLCLSMAVFGLPIAGGFAQGTAIALFHSNIQTLTFFHGLLHYSAPVLVCAAIALTWCAARWVLADEPSHRPRLHFRTTQNACLLAAASAAITVASINAFAFLGAAAQAKTVPFDSTPWLLFKSFQIAAVALVASLLLVLAVRRGNPVRWPWALLLLLIPLAGEISGGFVFLLAVLCDPPRSEKLTGTSEAPRI